MLKKLILSLFLSAAAFLPAAEKLVFSCQYDRGFAPEICAQPVHVGPHNVRIVDVGSQGKALRFGNMSSAKPGFLLYELKDRKSVLKLPENQQPFPMHFGKLQFRFRPVGWSLNDPEYNMFLRIEGPLGSVLHIVYIRPQGVPSVQVAYGQFKNPSVEKGRIPVIYPYAPLAKDREWHDVSLEWRPDRLILTVDGNTVNQSTSSLSYPAEQFHGQQLWIGYYSKSLMRGETDLAGLKIWSTLPAPKATQTGSRFPQVIVNPMKKAPVIDGSIGGEEWSGISCYTGFLKLPSASVSCHQPRVRIGYDSRALYIAVQSTGHKRAPLAAKTKRDDNLWLDDGMEVFLGSASRPDEFYQFIINHAGVLYDRHHYAGASSLEEVSWNSPGIRTASKISGENWDMEIAIPFADLGRKAPAPGDSLYFNVCETIVGSGYYSLAAIRSSYAEYENFGILNFGDGASPVIDFSDLGPLYRGEAAFKCGVRGGGAVKFEVNAKRFDATAKSEFHLFGKTAEVSAGPRVCFQASPEELGKNGLLYSNIYQNGQKIYSGRLFYEIIQKVEIENMRRIVKDGRNHLRVTTTHLNSGENFIRFTVSASGGRKYLKKQVPLTDMKQHTLLDISGLKEGDYMVLVEIVNGGGAVRQKSVPRPFTVYGKVPPWRGFIADHVSADHVPAPWTPLKVTADKGRIIVACWNRSFVFSSRSLFAEQFISSELPFLASPAVLRIGSQGHAVPVRGIRTRVLASSERRVTVQSIGTTASSDKITVLADIDYDGFIWYQVRFVPAAAVSIDRFSLALQMPRENSTLLNTSYRNLQDTGRTPEAWGKSLEGECGPFWIGNEKGGLSFGLESTRYWRNRKHTLQAEVQRKKELTEVRINMIDMPTEIKKPLIYEFYIMPTPVRPRPEGFRELRGQNWFAHNYCAANGKGYPSNLSWWNATWNYQGYPSWETEREGIARLFKVPLEKMSPRDYRTFANADKKYNRSAWYTAYSSVGRNAPEVIWNGEDWHAGMQERTYGNTIYGYAEDMIDVCKTQDYRDFYLWRFDKSRRESPCIDGLYFDLWCPPPCNREDHGHGYTDENGVRKSVYPLREHRKWMEEIYIYCKEQADGAPIVAHVSGATAQIAGYGYADYLLDGELWFDVLARDRSYKAMTLDQARAEILPHIWGPGLIWLSELHRAKGYVPAHQSKTWKLSPWAFRHISALLLIHDVIPERTSLFDTAWQVWKALDLFGLNDRDRILPYWEENCGIGGDSNGRDAAVTAFLKPGEKRLMLVIFNNRDQKMDFKVSLDLEKLFGSRGAVQLRDLEKNSLLPGRKPVFSVPVEIRDFRLIEARLISSALR